MTLIQVLILGIIQGLAELLPVSSSAHVIAAEKLMGLDPSRPEMTLLLVMLHTGTMFAVIVYFWKRWKLAITTAEGGWKFFLRALLIATLITGVVGLALKTIIEKFFMGGHDKAEIELLFSNMQLVGAALIAAGAVILLSSRIKTRVTAGPISDRQSAIIGAVQGLCLPFRGFSRSGATISTAMLAGVEKFKAEDFSFALAVILTPPVVAREFLRLVKHQRENLISNGGAPFSINFESLTPSLLGMLFSFVAGLLALRWLSSWIAADRWQWFGYYCLVAGASIALFL